MVEFALVLPIFAIMLFGIIDLGRYVYTGNALSNGAREGARSGSVANRPSPTCDGLTREACVIAIASSNAWGVPASAISTTVTCARVAPGDTTPNTVSIGECRTNDLLTARSTTDFTLVTPIVAQFIGSLTISGDSQVTVNQ
jgi:Flp pilus assembly protein TadG